MKKKPSNNLSTCFLRTAVLALALLPVAAQLAAQNDIGLQYMRGTWQVNAANPAVVQPCRIVVSLPGVANHLSFDGPTYNQILTTQNGQPVVDIDQLIGHLDAENAIREDLSVPTLGLAFKVKNLTVSVGHTLRYHAFFKYPKTLPQVVWQGNAQFVGETVALGNELQLSGYHELAIGAAYQLGNLTFGAKAKLLGGIADATTSRDHHSASLYTDPDVYQLTVEGDYLLHTAKSLDYDDVENVDLDFDFAKLAFEELFGKNQGVAVDLGARFKTAKLDVAASLTDLGSITWDEGVTNYAATQTYLYTGLDISSALTGEDIGFGDALDTLKEIFQVVETSTAYTNRLPQKIHLSALYHLTDMWSVGGAFFHETFRGSAVTAASVGVNVSPWKVLHAGAFYTIKQNKQFDNLGLHATLNLGPVQVFGVTDNVLALANPGDASDFTARAGMALLLGRE